MQQIKTIRISVDDKTTKDFTVKELKIKDLIELSQTNTLLSGAPTSKKQPEFIPGFTFLNNLLAFRPDVESILSKSSDFNFDDLIELPPSDIKEIYDGFLEVNQTFLGVLESLGIKEILVQLIKDFTEVFSNQPAS